MKATKRDVEIWQRAQHYPYEKALEYEDVLSIDKNIKGLKILDYGCGNGRDCFKFAELNADITGVDIVPENIKYSKEKQKELNLNVNFLLLDDNNKLPFADETFDIINCNGVLHHIKNVVEVLNELYRVLKKDGIFYCMLYSEYMFIEYHNHFLNKNCNVEFVLGQLTDRCEYATFYTVDMAKILFRDFKLIEEALYRDNMFRGYIWRKK